MNNWVTTILVILVLTVVSLFIFYAIKAYILTKYNINKWYLIVLLFILLTLPFFLQKYYTYLVVQIAQMTLVSVTFLTYMEIAKMDREKKNRPVVGRPKQKPSRARQNGGK
jgi:energy-coupling factor transporter transmembrane protein EcfT